MLQQVELPIQLKTSQAEPSNQIYNETILSDIYGVYLCSACNCRSKHLVSRRNFNPKGDAEFFKHSTFSHSNKRLNVLGSSEKLRDVDTRTTSYSPSRRKSTFRFRMHRSLFLYTEKTNQRHQDTPQTKRTPKHEKSSWSTAKPHRGKKSDSLAS